MMCKWNIDYAWVFFVVLSLTAPAYAVSVAPEELTIARRWAQEHFVRAEKPASEESGSKDAAKPGLVVLDNYGPVQQNGRDGGPLKIAETQFRRGLYCHAISRVLVRLPGPGKAFTAKVGIDTNGQYTGGSAEFTVSVGDKRAFKSPVKHRGEPPTPVDVDLAGATEFVIAVGCGGDNINSDQATWADAKVTLADGREVWLGDLPLIEASLHNRRADIPPFSFLYGGVCSDELLGQWRFEETAVEESGGRKKRTQTYTDPKTGLSVRCEIVEYTDYPTVEWKLSFKNTGDADTPLLSQIQALDTRFRRDSDGEFLLHHFTGSPCLATDYQPFEDALTPNSVKRITTSGGRPTNSDLPYFNLETGGGGAVIALGWAGQWAATFQRDAGDGLRVAGGQERTRFLLHPGEEVRGPMVVLQFYQGDWIRAQNVWRRWMIAHNLPRPGGKPLEPMASACNGNHYPGIITNAKEELHFLRRYLEEGIKPDYWWQDAGWYPCDGVGWSKTGTWEVDKSRWPNSIREVSDWCRERDIQTIVWFEPERVHAGTWLTENRPEWVHGGKNGGLLKLGNEECRKWITDRVDRLINEEGIDLYRQDFNIDPLGYWRGADTENRQGITEIRHVEGYFAFWDELLRRHPGMLIDSCASGGRRNDLETLRRAVPLLRSDYLFEPVGEQNHTYGISFWMPFNGSGFLTVDPYLVRSQMSPEFTLGVDTRRKDLDYDLLRKLYREWREVAPYYLGDYWPLTPYSTANDLWMAWQFDRPDLGEGFVQAFRRGECDQREIRLKLRGLDHEATYTLVDFDVNEPWKAKGRELMNEGLTVNAEKRPEARMIRYRKVGEKR